MTSFNNNPGSNALGNNVLGGGVMLPVNNSLNESTAKSDIRLMGSAIQLAMEMYPLPALSTGEFGAKLQEK